MAAAVASSREEEVWGELPGCQRRQKESVSIPLIPGFKTSDRGQPPGEAQSCLHAQTNVRQDVIEASLAHVVRDPTVAAYARSDLFERRRRLMDDWAAYLSTGTDGGGG